MDEELRRIMNSLQKEYPKAQLSTAEKLSIAVQIQRNDILKRAFVLDYGDKVPGALEAITRAIKGEN